METEDVADPFIQIGTSSRASPDPLKRIEHTFAHPGNLIRELRQSLWMSQRELSRRSGIRQPQICAIEAGKDAVHSTYARLIEAMGAEFRISTKISRPREEISAELVAERLAAQKRAEERRRERLFRRRSR
jgi:transcriptional regulator with XRE-family HTH domain